MRQGRTPDLGEGGDVAGVGEGRGAAGLFTSRTLKPSEADSLTCAPSASSIAEPLMPLPGGRVATTKATCILGAAGPERSQSCNAGTRGATCGTTVSLRESPVPEPNTKENTSISAET